MPPEDKQKISELLKKPWNPYIRRHSALTEKSKILKEVTLRTYAGWSTNSNMPQIYTHYYGNEAVDSLLEAYGIVTKDGSHKKMRLEDQNNALTAMNQISLIQSSVLNAGWY